MFLQCNQIKVVQYCSPKCQLFKERKQPTKVRFLLSWFKNLFLLILLFSHEWVSLNSASSRSTPTLFLIYLTLGLSGFLIYVSFISKPACGSCRLVLTLYPVHSPFPKPLSSAVFCVHMPHNELGNPARHKSTPCPPSGVGKLPGFFIFKIGKIHKIWKLNEIVCTKSQAYQASSVTAIDDISRGEVLMIYSKNRNGTLVGPEDHTFFPGQD